MHGMDKWLHAYEERRTEAFNVARRLPRLRSREISIGKLVRRNDGPEELVQ